MRDEGAYPVRHGVPAHQVPQGWSMRPLSSAVAFRSSSGAYQPRRWRRYYVLPAAATGNDP